MNESHSRHVSVRDLLLVTMFGGIAFTCCRFFDLGRHDEDMLLQVLFYLRTIIAVYVFSTLGFLFAGQSRQEALDRPGRVAILALAMAFTAGFLNLWPYAVWSERTIIEALQHMVYESSLDSFSVAPAYSVLAAWGITATRGHMSWRLDWIEVSGWLAGTFWIACLLTERFVVEYGSRNGFIH